MGELGEKMGKDDPWAVLDIGGFSINAGKSDEDSPEFSLLNCIADGEVAPSNSGFEDADGEAHNKYYDKIQWPVEAGAAPDPEEMIPIYEHLMGSDCLDIDHPKKDIAGVFLVEPVLNPPANRIAAAEHFFETADVARFYVGLQAHCVMDSQGRESAICIGQGHGVTEVVTTYMKYDLRHTAQRVNWGGKNLSDYLRVQLMEDDISLGTSDKTDELIFRAMKEQLCQTAGKGKYDELKDKKSEDFTLPDGSKITCNVHTLPEAVICPSMAGRPIPGIIDMLEASLELTPNDAIEELTGSILLYGQSLTFPDMKKRIVEEVEELRPNNKVRVFQFPEGPIMIWQGARILAEKSEFYDPQEDQPKPFIKKKEWDEFGKSSIRRLCPC